MRNDSAPNDLPADIPTCPKGEVEERMPPISLPRNSLVTGRALSVRGLLGPMLLNEGMFGIFALGIYLFSVRGILFGSAFNLKGRGHTETSRVGWSMRAFVVLQIEGRHQNSHELNDW